MAKKTLTADFSASGGETTITLEVTQAKLDLNIDADYFAPYALYLAGSLAKKITKVTMKSRDDETNIVILLPETDAGVDMADLNEQWSIKAGGHEPMRLKVSHGMQIVFKLASAAVAAETVVALCTVENGIVGPQNVPNRSTNARLKYTENYAPVGLTGTRYNQPTGAIGTGPFDGGNLEL